MADDVERLRHDKSSGLVAFKVILRLLCAIVSSLTRNSITAGLVV